MHQAEGNFGEHTNCEADLGAPLCACEITNLTELVAA